MSSAMIATALLFTIASAQAPAALETVARPPSHASVTTPRFKGAHGLVILDGVAVRAWWNDGDSFRPERGRRERNARVVGYNTLEMHGPVHQWGTWTGAELLALSARATEVAALKERHCTSAGKPDGYGRPLVRCPDVARELVEAGLAMVFAVDEAPDRELVTLQLAAQAKGRGMWARGIPETILTSVHSVGEVDSRMKGGGASGGSTTAHNRVAYTRTGKTVELRHADTLQVCQVVCNGTGSDKSCMTYVPFERHHRERPDCLK